MFTNKKGVSITDAIIVFASRAVAQTIIAPVDRVKLLLQTQDVNPRIISGEVNRYSGILNVCSRIAKEQGIISFWRGNMSNILRIVPTQGFNFALKDFFKGLFPRYNSKTYFSKFFIIQIASGALAGGSVLMISYPLDYTRLRMAADVGSGKPEFNGMWDCLKRTSSGPRGPLAIYNGFGVSLLGIVVYRGAYFGYSTQ